MLLFVLSFYRPVANHQGHCFFFKQISLTCMWQHFKFCCALIKCNCQFIIILCIIRWLSLWITTWLLACNLIVLSFLPRSSAITSSEPRLPCPALWSSQCHCYCTVGVPRVWWRSPSGQLYHQWHQHYDNHLTNQWNHTYSTIQCKTNYRGCCH